MMQRRHFERISQVFRVNKPHDMGVDGVRLWEEILSDMCVELRASNPRFDEDKFRKACEPNG
jgi:hypothetical protein